MITSPVLAVASSLALPAMKIAPFWALATGCLLQVLGCGLMVLFWKNDRLIIMYIAEAVLGSGLGLNSNTVTLAAGMLVPRSQLGLYNTDRYFSRSDADTFSGSAVAALVQIRLIGGIVGVSIWYYHLLSHANSDTDRVTVLLF